MSTISTHVLDTALGRPAAGMTVSLERLDGVQALPLGTGITDVDGRVVVLSRSPLTAGVHRLTFDTAGYFATTDQRGLRSEEHTSELQSRGHLVCRLLLEKKKSSFFIKHMFCLMVS